MSGPLEGVRVLDFATALAGPWAAGILADQGADVIKIEQPGGDFSRSAGTVHGTVSAMWHLANRGKRSVVLDLRSEEGRRVAVELAATADMVVQNFRPGVAERLGVGYEQLRAVNDELIFVAVTGFGLDGPYAGRQAFDSIVQSVSGMAHVHGSPDGEPALCVETIADKVTALTAAQAAVAALFARERGGGGQRVDVPMLDATIAFLWMDMAGPQTLLDATDDETEPVGGVRRFIRFTDGWGMVSIHRPVDLRGAAEAFGVAPDDPSASLGDETRDAVRSAVSGLSLETAGARLATARVPFGPARTLDDVHLDPHVVASGVFTESVHPQGGLIREPRPPVRFSATPTGVPAPSPAVGEHTDDVLGRLQVELPG